MFNAILFLFCFCMKQGEISMWNKINFTCRASTLTFLYIRKKERGICHTAKKMGKKGTRVDTEKICGGH